MREGQEQLSVAGDDRELACSVPAAVVKSYLNDICEMVSQLSQPDLDDGCGGGESVALTSVALHRENDALRRRVDKVQTEKRDLEERLGHMEQLVTLARELKDENEGMIRDFRLLERSIAVEQESDAAEIGELTRSFRELIAENELLRQNNEELIARTSQLGDLQWASPSGKFQQHSDPAAGRYPSSSSPVVAESAQESQIEVDCRSAAAAIKDGLATEAQTATDDAQVGAPARARTSGVVAELMADIRRKNDEMSRLHENIGRMDRVLSEIARTTSAMHIATEDTGHNKQWDSVDGQHSTRSIVDGEFSERGKCDSDRSSSKLQEVPALPKCEGAAVVAERMTRQTSTDSGMSRGRSFEHGRDHDSSLGDSSGLPFQADMQTESQLIRLSTECGHLIADNRRLRAALAELAAASGASTRTTGEDHEVGGGAAALRCHAAQLESEIAALKQTMKEQSVFLSAGTARMHNDDWAHPYDDSGSETPVTGEENFDEGEDDDDDDTVTVDVLRRQNAQLKRKLAATKLRWNDAAVGETQNQFEEEMAKRRDQQTALLDELSSKSKKIEDLEELCRRQGTVSEIVDSYWSVLDKVERRRTPLKHDDDGNFDPRGTDAERTAEAFGSRLEVWLKDYETLISERNGRSLDGDVFQLCSIRKPEVVENTDEANVQQKGGKSSTTVVTHCEEDPLERNTPDQQTELTVDSLLANLEQLRLEAKTKGDELRRKREEVAQMRIENEALQAAASSSSPRADGECKQLLSEIERLTLDRNILKQRLQDTQNDADKMREDLSGEKDRLTRQLDALRELAEKDRTSRDDEVERLTSENRIVRDAMLKLEVDCRASDESHLARLAESVERLRAAEEKAAAENDRLHGELDVVIEERRQLRENCAKMESDCLAFQELSSEMVERCERLSIELERMRRSGGAVSGSRDREIQALQDQNSRLTTILELERLKNFAIERPTMADSQTDTADLASFGSGTGGGGRERSVDGTGDDGWDGDAGHPEMSPVLDHARAALASAVRLRRLMNAEHFDVDGQPAPAIAEADGARVSKDQLDIVDRLALELDALLKSLATKERGRSEEHLPNGHNCDTTYNNVAPADNCQLHELQQLLEV